jgi:phosphate transport system substrate-binding protein
MSDVLADRVNIGMCSREVTPPEAAQGAVAMTVCKDAVVAVINARNPVLQDLQRKGVGKETLAALWLQGKVSAWGDVAGTAREAPLRVFTRSDACGAAETWANYLGGTQADLKGARVYGDPGIRDAVRRDPLALGYNNVNYAYDPRTGKPAAGLTILPLDVNGNGVLEKEEDFYRTREELVAAIRRGDYPSPPARDLYFVVKGSLTNEPLRTFLAWVLTDGQKFVPESGYLHPPAEQRRAGLEALGEESRE